MAAAVEKNIQYGDNSDDVAANSQPATQETKIV